jgi:hypothetical protein
MHEEPIVCSPYDAIRAFKLGGLDYLAIGNWVAKNPVPVKRRVDRSRLESYLNRRGVPGKGVAPAQSGKELVKV